MAKQQTYGDKALEKKLAGRKMAKVIISKKNAKGSFSYHETTVNVDNIQDFIANNRA